MAMSVITITSPTSQKVNTSKVCLCPKCSLPMTIKDIYNRKGNKFWGTSGYCYNGCKNNDDGLSYFVFSYDIDDLIEKCNRIALL